jgi:hypothetical protein
MTAQISDSERQDSHARWVPDRRESASPVRASCAPSGRDHPLPFLSISTPAIRLWARSRSGVVEQAVAKRLVGRPSFGGIAARPKFSAEVDANLDHRRPGPLELGVEMFEPGLHLAGFDRGDLLLAQILGAAARRSRAATWFGSIGPAAWRTGEVFCLSVWAMTRLSFDRGQYQRGRSR